MTNRSTATTVKKSPVNGVEMLQAGRNNNFLEVKKQLMKHLQQTYGCLGNFIKNNEYHVIPLPDIVTMTVDEVGNEELKRKITEARYIAYEKEIRQWKKKKEIIYGEILSILDDESQDLIESQTRWSDIDNGQEPLELWRLITQTHSTGVNNGSVAELQQEAKAKYNRLYQKDNQTLLEFKNEFKHVVENLKILEVIAIPAEENLALDFLWKVNKKYYGDVINQLKNNVRRSIENYPTTVEKAYELLKQYTSVNTSIYDKDDTQSITTGFNSMIHKRPNITCHTCGMRGHISKNCIRNQHNNSDNYNQQTVQRNNNYNNNFNRNNNHNNNNYFNNRHNNNNVRNNNNNNNNNYRNNNFNNNQQNNNNNRFNNNNNNNNFNRNNNNMNNNINYNNRNYNQNNQTSTDSNITDNKNDTKKSAVQFYSNDDVEHNDNDDNNRESTNCDDEEDISTSKESEKNICKDIFIYDTGATHHMVNDISLLHNVKQLPSPIEIVGINGRKKCEIVGDLHKLGSAYYDPDAHANLISAARVEKLFRVSREQQTHYIIHVDESTELVFKYNKNGLYTCSKENITVKIEETQELIYEKDSIMHATVENKKLVYTRDEIKRADKAGEILKQLGYASYQDLIRLIHKGSIINAPITSRDVLTYIDIYGKQNIEGTMTSKPPRPTPREEYCVPVRTVQEFHSDIGFFDGVPLLITVVKPINMLMATDINGQRPIEELEKALLEQIRLLNNNSFEIMKIHTDGEAAMRSLQRRGVIRNMYIIGAGSHEPVAEAAIKVIKNRCRSIIANLVYTLPSKLITHLVFYAVNRINCIPRDSGIGISAREAFRNIKFDYNKDLKLEFGQLTQVYKNNSSNSINQKRAIKCLSLHPVENGRGTWNFYNLESQAVITSDNWTIVPFAQKDIDDINELSMKKKTPNVQAVSNRINDNIFKEVLSESQSNTSVKNINNINKDQEIVNNTNDKEEENVDDKKNEELELVEDKEMIVPEIDKIHNMNSMITENELVIIPQIYHISIYKGIKMYDNMALDSIKAELKQMLDKEVWTPQEKDFITNKKIIPSSMFIKEKFDETGNLIKLKSRLVAGGNEQDKEEIYDNSSPTVSNESLFMILAIAAGERRHFRTFDVQGAYLEAKMTEEVYMELSRTLTNMLVELEPKYGNYVKENGKCVVRLTKALYGCVESARLWYFTFINVLNELGFIMNEYDKNVFNKMIRGKQLTICFHVDDGLITHEDEDVINEIIDEIEKNFTKITRDTMDNAEFLGMRIARENDGSININMDKYTKEAVVWSNVNGTSKTPHDGNLFKIDESSPMLKESESKKFHSGVAKLLYLAKRVRPEILVSISFLSSRVLHSTVEDESKLRKVFKYLNNNEKISINYTGGGNNQIIAYGDAAYLVHQDCESRTGTVLMMNDGIILGRSSKQKLISKSSTEAELIANAETMTDIVICMNFLDNQEITQNSIKCYTDNVSITHILKKYTNQYRNTKHINHKYFYTKQFIDTGQVELLWKSNSYIIADLLTKPVLGSLFKELRKIMLKID